MHRLLLFATISAAGLAAAVQGLVLDPSGRAIRGARVECAGRSVLTALDGRFTIPDTDRCDAVITSPGFEPYRAELAAGVEARIELAVAGVTERIVVTATRHETTAEEAGVSANVLTVADLRRRQFPAIGDVLREVPGLQIAQYGRHGSLTQAYTRGAQRTGTLFLLDGVPLSDPGGEVNLANLSTAFIERVEVVRGPESALFGAEAAAGVVQLFTRRGDPESRVPRGSVSYERGSFQTDRWVASLSGGAGARADYSLGAEQFHTAGEFPNDAWRHTSGTANAGVRLAANTQLRGVFREADAFAGTPNQVGYGLIDFDAREETRDTATALRLEDARGDHYLQRASFGYHRLRDLFRNSRGDGPYEVAALVRDVPGRVSRVYLERLLDPRRLPAETPAGTRVVAQSVTLFADPEPFLNIASRKTFDYQGTLTHSGGSAVFGYDYERQAGQITGGEVGRANHGVFVHKQQQTAGGRVFLAGGVRLEHSSAFGNKFVPRGAATFRLSGEHGPLSSTFFRLAAGRGINEPGLLENFARDPYFVGNPNLRPEKTASYEAGLVQEWLGRRLRAEVTAFRNSFKDLIAFVFVPFPSTWQNVEASWARGLEFSAQAKPASWLAFSGNYTRMWTRVTRSSAPGSLFNGIGQELPRRAGNAGALSFSLTPRRWWLQAGARLVGERQDFDLFGVTRNPGYQDVYAAGSWQIGPHVAPFLRMDNLLNTRYQEVLGYSNQARSVRGGVRLSW